MKLEDEVKINRLYPELYRFASAQSVVADDDRVFHFQCHSGWYRIIYDFTVEVADAVRKEGLGQFPDVHPVVVVAKEKFGVLVLVVSSPTNQLKPALAAASKRAADRSKSICEMCGLLGELLTDDGCYRVRCAHCEANWRDRIFT